MKPYKLKFSPKQDNFILTDKGKRTLHPLSGEERVKSILDIVKDKRIGLFFVHFGIFHSYVSPSNVRVWSRNRDWKSTSLIITINDNDKIFFWISRGLVMRGINRLTAKPIKREDFSIEFILNK